MIDVSKQLPAVSNGKRKLEDLVYAVVHHDGVKAPKDYDAIALYKREAKDHVKKGWGRLAYHFKIDNKGIVYQCSPLTEIAYHSGNPGYHRNSVGICLDGDFTKQGVPEVQLKALEGLLNYLCKQRPDIPKLVRKNVRYHGEVRGFTNSKGVFIPNPTACPGKPIIEFVKSYR